MKPLSWLGILLIVLGALALLYQGINYTREKQVVNVGSLHLTAETQQHVPIPPIVGGLALVGGIFLLVMGARGKA